MSFLKSKIFVSKSWRNVSLSLLNLSRAWIQMKRKGARNFPTYQEASRILNTLEVIIKKVHNPDNILTW